MSAISNLNRSLSKLGIVGTIRLLVEKRAKKRRLSKLLSRNPETAWLISGVNAAIEISEKERETIIERANEMLRDENYVFSFLHNLKNISDPWNYDPIEEKYWPKRHYEETKVHTSDTPKDVKIVWEVNRFKYLPLLAQAAFHTKEKKYVDEVEWRILSWIEGNPFAASVNWSSPLEIAIRGISWAATLRLLSFAGFDLYKNDAIARSIWQHAAYLNAQLSIDKIVRSNHLIGETAGLYILASLFDFPEKEFYRLRSEKIFDDSILKQTYMDGVSKESSGWYHTFVTDFADLVDRLRTTNHEPKTPMSGRLRQMQLYRNSIIATDKEVVKYGDCDYGKAINLSHAWKKIIFGPSEERTERRDYFDTAQHVTGQIDKNYFFVRAGDFGWGADGFSSHAHDDFLSPIVTLDGLPVIVDPGTYVYNGNAPERDKYRTAEYHNGLIVSSSDSLRQRLKPNFGWLTVRPNASIDFFQKTDNEITAETSYGESRHWHRRKFVLGKKEFVIEDNFEPYTFEGKEVDLEWNFHFHPRWRLERVSSRTFALRDYRNNRCTFELSSDSGELELLPYDFSPAYLRKSPAYKVRLKMTAGLLTNITFSLISGATNEQLTINS